MRLLSSSGFTIEVLAPGRLFLGSSLSLSLSLSLFGRFFLGEAPLLFLVAMESLVVIQVSNEAAQMSA